MGRDNNGSEGDTLRGGLNARSGCGVRSFPFVLGQSVCSDAELQAGETG